MTIISFKICISAVHIIFKPRELINLKWLKMDFYIGPLPFSIQTHVILNINLTNLLKVLGLTNNKFLDGMVFLSWIIDELLEAKAMILIKTWFFLV